MGGSKRECIEFRFYEKPDQEPVLALTGESWNRDYSKGNKELHFHNMVEIGYCHRGKGQVVLNKEYYDYKEGTFTFIPQNYPHSTNSDIRSHWGFLYFDAEELILDAFSSNLYKGEKIRTSITTDAYVLTISEAPYLGNLVLMVFELASQGGNYSKDSIRCALMNIIFQILRIKEAGVQSSSSENRSKIVSALEYISKHYTEEIMIGDLAECCHLSETHFRRLFQTDMNMTPVEYINLIRVQAACDLMKKEDCQMEQVAARAGYQTMSTFNRNFKQIIGISPYQWKKQVTSNVRGRGKYRVHAKKGWEF